MRNYCKNCEFRNPCDLRDCVNFCVDCKDYYHCNILKDCEAGHSVECNNGFEDGTFNYDDEDEENEEE